MSLSLRSCEIALAALSHFDFKVTDDNQADEFVEWRRAVLELRELKETLLNKGTAKDED